MTSWSVALPLLLGLEAAGVDWAYPLAGRSDASMAAAIAQRTPFSLRAWRPVNVIFSATSTRRHLLPRDMIDNERSTAINPSEAVEEKVSLSDRFGLWLGFHRCSQEE